ncbi:hypothetical protein [Actinomadura rubrisoli]|uniref:Uncharacterized protein n=1 Tax=Actinomadura rubrisoli TaxID=2530368 RepID=A0A4R5CAT1_9ACTN|nr:hypothetical protein [Actinomadura rubrisoli]TDD95310.1 hypothetical protein E1298_05445 [Actinomadura rubrisoli]
MAGEHRVVCWALREIDFNKRDQICPKPGTRTSLVQVQPCPDSVISGGGPMAFIRAVSSGEYQVFDMSLDVEVSDAKIIGWFTVVRGVHAAGPAGLGRERRQVRRRPIRARPRARV